MKKLLGPIIGVIVIVGIILFVVMNKDTRSVDEQCNTSFNCVKIEDDKQTCNTCKDGTKSCTNPRSVICPIEK